MLNSCTIKENYHFNCLSKGYTMIRNVSKYLYSVFSPAQVSVFPLHNTIELLNKSEKWQLVVVHGLLDCTNGPGSFELLGDSLLRAHH